MSLKKLLALCALALVLSLAGGSALPAMAQDTLTVAMAMDAKTLDPHGTNDVASNTVMDQIYQNLMVLTADGKLVPQLAERYERLDGKTYKFYLKKGVLFHNGEELKASDVVYSFKRAISPKGSAVRNYASAIDPDGFETPDDYTVIIRTKEVNTPFLASLSHVGFGCILSEKATEEAGDNYGQHPVGTGPYKFVSWAKGNKIVLERFDGFHGEKPAAKTMVLRTITEATTRTIELETGAVDIALDITPNDLKRVEENKDLKLLRKTGNLTTYVGMNTAKKPFDDPRVRKAISLALDTEGITYAVFRGVGTTPKGPMSPGVLYYDDNLEPQQYNDKEAKKLLKEAGYKKGFKVQIWTSDRKERRDIATIVQAMLAEVGIEAEIKVLEWGAFLEGLKAGEHDLFVLGWIPSVPDPNFALEACFTESVWNFSRVNDPDLTALIKKGKALPNGEERAQVYSQAQARINEILPWIYIQNNEFLVGTRSNVVGFEPSSNGIHHLYNASFAE